MDLHRSSSKWEFVEIVQNIIWLSDNSDLDEYHWVEHPWSSWNQNRIKRRSCSTCQFSVNKKVTTCSKVMEDKSIQGRTTMTSSSLKRISSLRKSSSYMNDIEFSVWRIYRMLIRKFIRNFEKMIERMKKII